MTLHLCSSASQRVGEAARPGDPPPFRHPARRFFPPKPRSSFQQPHIDIMSHIIPSFFSNFPNAHRRLIKT
jgi:hypothetical protein